MRRGWLLGLGVVMVFAVLVALMIKLMPGPLKDSDYLVIGSVATLISMLVLFLALISTSMKSSDVFFKRRRK